MGNHNADNIVVGQWAAFTLLPEGPRLGFGEGHFVYFGGSKVVRNVFRDDHRATQKSGRIQGHQPPKLKPSWRGNKNSCWGAKNGTQDRRNERNTVRGARGRGSHF